MADHEDRDASSVGQGLVRLMVAVDAAYTRASRDLELTAQQAQLLCASLRPAAISDLAAALHCDRSNASRLVDRAAKRGLLVRRRGADPDGRVTLVELTPEGRRSVDRFIEILQETIDPLFDDWPPERQASALDVLNALAGTLEGAATPR